MRPIYLSGVGVSQINFLRDISFPLSHAAQLFIPIWLKNKEEFTVDYVMTGRYICEINKKYCNRGLCTDTEAAAWSHWNACAAPLAGSKSTSPPPPIFKRQGKWHPVHNVLNGTNLTLDARRSVWLGP